MSGIIIPGHACKHLTAGSGAAWTSRRSGACVVIMERCGRKIEVVYNLVRRRRGRSSIVLSGGNGLCDPQPPIEARCHEGVGWTNHYYYVLLGVGVGLEFGLPYPNSIPNHRCHS